jgi:hypothetical protein
LTCTRRTAPEFLLLLFLVVEEEVLPLAAAVDLELRLVVDEALADVPGASSTPAGWGVGSSLAGGACSVGGGSSL